MAQELKHVGRVKATNKKCLVAYRTRPGDAHHCLIIPTENLPDFNYIDILEILFKLPNSIHVIISFHPFENNDIRNSITELIKNKPNFKVLTKDQNTYYGISISKIVIGSYSTCLLEALHLGRKIISIKNKKNNTNIFSHYSSSELYQMVNYTDLEQLNDKILKLLIDNEKITHQANFLFAEDFLNENKKMIESLFN